MADDLKLIRDEYQSDLEDWSVARDGRAKCMKALGGDPWPQADREARDAASRPCLTFDELSQYVNQIVNEVRANPRSVKFAPTGPGTSTKAAEFYADKMREIEYRSHAQLAYTAAFESAVMGAYGFVRVSKEFMPDSVDRQELVITPVMDPNTVIPNWSFQRPDLSDMTRCTVLEWRQTNEFLQQFPKAKTQSFEAFQKDDAYKGWFTEKRILLAERWDVTQVLKKLLLVQPPAVQPPSSQFGFRPPQAPPPVTIPVEQWATMPPGSKVIREREAMQPKVTQKLVNGCEILSETSWPGPYIPIAGCMGRMLFLDDGGVSNRLLLSAVSLALDPLLAYCFYRTSEMENVGMTTKNPFFAYEGQISPTQQEEYAKSMHEPVTVLFAKPTVEGAPPGQLLPLPRRNVDEPAIQAVSVAAEEARRAIQSGMATNFMPTQAQRQNEKSGKALQQIQAAAMRGTYHFVDHYEMMLRQVGCICEAAMPEVYDTKREVLVRRGDDTTAQIWVNDPGNKEAIDPKGNYAVTVSSGPSFDSTQEAADEFSQLLLTSAEFMALIGPQKAQKVAALALKLKVNQAGLGAVGQQIVDIIDPPQEEGQEADPAQLQAALQQADQIMQQLMARVKELESEQQGKIAIEQVKGEIQQAIQALKGEQKADELVLKGTIDKALQDDKQAHEAAIASADDAAETARTDAQMLATVASAGREQGGGKPNGAQK